MIYHGDCEAFLSTCGQFDCIIADPPDNIGLKYDGYVDNRVDYYPWLLRVIRSAMTKAPVVWVSYYWKHDFEIKARLLPFLNGWDARTFIWRFTFGQHRNTDCGSGYRPILRLSRAGFPWDCESIKVPSWREENGDKRAKPGGRVPDDVFEFPRVVGNANERRAWHSTQHPEALYVRVIKLSGALRGNFRVLDLFGGTGTLLRAAKALSYKNPGIEATVCERSLAYCKKIALEHPDSEIKENG